jgi:hypothetical protein
MTEATPIAVEADDLHIARSRYLDAFAGLETALTEVLRAGGETSLAISMGQRLAKLRALAPNRMLTKANVGKVSALADKLAEAATIRADIVHGLVTAHVIDGTPTFRLVNPLNAHEKPPLCRLVTRVDLERLARQASALTEEIRALRRNVSPASSPPPPSPDAAGGP